MRIDTWNIQATLGCDGRHDADRIADVLKAGGPADVICLQEVSRYFPEYGGDDQLAFFTAAFPGHVPVWGAALSYQGTPHRQEFGNLTLVKHALLADYRVHPLPGPPVQQVVQMPRCAVETAIMAGGQMITVLNAHLAFHDKQERRAQLQHLASIKNDGVARLHQSARLSGDGAYRILPESPHYILTGDLNTPSSGPVWDAVTEDWLDSHVVLNPGQAHDATCGIHDQQQWPEGPHCRDFFLVTESLESSLSRIAVNSDTDASDHQPVSLDLNIEL